jgi:hypothetical protein
MSQFLADLGIAPTTSPFAVEFSDWVNGILPTAGASGVPDQLTEPAQCATYLTGLRTVLEHTSKLRPTIRVFDGSLAANCYLTGEIDCSVEELANDTGKCSVTINYDNWLVSWMTIQTMPSQDLNLVVDHPTNPNWRTRWGGKITEIHVQQDEKGVHSIKLVAISFREHAKRLLVGANPIFPPEVQLPRLWVLPGPVRTVCAITSFVNLARLFEPILSTIDNIFNPAGWLNPLNPDAALNLLPTAWPIQVAFVNPVTDQSRWSAIGAGWTTTWHDAYKGLLSDAGCVMRVYTYLTTDADSPNTELAQLVDAAPDILIDVVSEIVGLGDITAEFNTTVQELTAPQRNCVVFSFEDVSGVTGPTGTALDGLLSTVAVTLDDLITPVTIDLATGNVYDPGQVLNGETVQDATGIGQTFLLEQLVNVAPNPPQVIWWDGQWNGMQNTDLAWSRDNTKTTMVGSKSPVLINEAQTFGIKYALAELSDLIYYAAPGGLAAYQGSVQTPGTPGLDSLYQNQLDDVLFAWERFTDPIRALYAGDVAWQEHYQKGSSGTAYTLASILDMRLGDWNTRTFAIFQAKTYDAHPWIANYDYFLGDRVGFEQNGIIYVDNIYSIKRTWSWSEPLVVSATVGEHRDMGDPFAAAFKTIGTLYNLVSSVVGEGTIFTG